MRLREIQGMDVNSFEYQTALQQITQQEQGEASAMLEQIKGAWVLGHYWYLWDWYGVLVFFGFLVLVFIVIGFWIWANE